MAAKEKTPTVAQKCRAFERIREIIEDEIELEEHLRKRSNSVRSGPDASDFARLSAYADIVFAVMRPDAIGRIWPRKKSPRRKPSTTNPAQKPTAPAKRAERSAGTSPKRLKRY